MSIDRNIRLRDQRIPGWYWSQNELIDQVAARVGVYGIAVYNALARLSRHDKVSGVSAERIAATLGCSRAQVFRSLAALETAGALMRRSVSGAESSYTLVDLKLKNLPPVSVSDGYAADNPPQSATGGVSDRAGTRLSQRQANKEAKLQDCKTELPVIALTDSFNSTEAAIYVGHNLDLAGRELQWMLRDVIDNEKKKTGATAKAIAEAMVDARRSYETVAKGSKFVWPAKAFFAQGIWKHSEDWKERSSAPPAGSARTQRNRAALEGLAAAIRQRDADCKHGDSNG